jgi:hypothetical protein
VWLPVWRLIRLSGGWRFGGWSDGCAAGGSVAGSVVVRLAGSAAGSVVVRLAGSAAGPTVVWPSVWRLARLSCGLPVGGFVVNRWLGLWRVATIE